MDMYGDEPELNNQQKAAILFIVLGPEYSSMLFKHMNDEEIEKVGMTALCIFSFRSLA